MDNIKTAALAGITGVMLFFCGVWAGRKTAPNEAEAAKARIEVRYDTARYVAPVAAKTRLAGMVTAVARADGGNAHVVLARECGKEVADTVAYTAMKGNCDSLLVSIPLEQKEYRDSDYTAYVSGFNARLDSIEVRSRVTTITKTETRWRRWNIGITAGYGYGFLSHKVEPFIGVGLTLRLNK